MTGRLVPSAAALAHCCVGLCSRTFCRCSDAKAFLMLSPRLRCLKWRHYIFRWCVLRPSRTYALALFWQSPSTSGSRSILKDVFLPDAWLLLARLQVWRVGLSVPYRSIGIRSSMVSSVFSVCVKVSPLAHRVRWGHMLIHVQRCATNQRGKVRVYMSKQRRWRKSFSLTYSFNPSAVGSMVVDSGS